MVLSVLLGVLVAAAAVAAVAPFFLASLIAPKSLVLEFVDGLEVFVSLLVRFLADGAIAYSFDGGA